MPQYAETMASGPGWCVSDIVCDAGPSDPRFEECHGDFCVAAVLAGQFHYRSGLGEALLAPGAILLGNAGAGFECGHEHSVGDRCLCVNLSADYLDSIASAVPGTKRPSFYRPVLPPSRCLAPLMASAFIARETGDPGMLEDIAARLAGYALAAQNDAASSSLRTTRLEVRRIADAARLIETQADNPEGETLSLASLARRADMPPYRFLRLFQRLLGVTPHQYILALRLQRAGVMLRLSDLGVSDIAYDAGFGDLSSFNRLFRAVMGASPRVYRATR